MSTSTMSTQASVVQVTPKPAKLLGFRHLQVVLTFVGALISGAVKHSFTITIVAMVDKNYSNPDLPEYNWSIQTQSVLLSACSWGYIILQLPGGLLAERFNPCIVITVSHVLSAMFCIAIPTAAALGWEHVFICRFLLGLTEGLLFPAIHVHLARWIPVEEKGTLVTIAIAGSTLGVSLGTLVGGQMSSSAAGWPSVFYLFGGLNIAWTVLWMLLGSNSPAEDGFISNKERAYIEDSLRTNKQETKPQKTPWKVILTSSPVWAIIVASSGFNWCSQMLVTEWPTYMKNVLKFNLTSNGLLSAIPPVFMFATSIGFGVASEYLVNRNIISLTFSRKLFNSIGFFLAAAALTGINYSQDTTLSIVLLVFATSISSASVVGFSLSHIDLAPNYAGTIFGVANSVAGFIGCTASLVVSAIVTDSGSRTQWQLVFLIAAGFYCLSGLFYAIFAQSSVQAWNNLLERRECIETWRYKGEINESFTDT